MNHRQSEERKKLQRSVSISNETWNKLKQYKHKIEKENGIKVATSPLIETAILSYLAK